VSSEQISGVSVVVLTRDRVGLLRRCLASIAAQNTPPLETVVVDNGGTDGSASVVRSEFPDVRLIENGENLGITGRNIGYRAACGKIILSLDDDIELTDPDTISKIVSVFEASDSLGAVTLKLLEEESGSEFVPHHWWHPKDRRVFQDREFETDRINEAAVAFDAEAIRKAGYYYESLFWGGEEWDLVLGLLDEGYVIRYLPISVMHLAPRGNMNFKADYRQALLVRNRFWIALRRLGPVDAMVVVAPRMVLWLLRAIRYGYLNHYLRGIFDLVWRLPQIRRERRPISAQTKLRMRRIRVR